jgi:hypothetical protein
MSGGHPSRILDAMSDYPTPSPMPTARLDPATDRSTAAGRVRRRRAAVVAGAAIAAIIVWALEDPIGGVNLAVKSGSSTRQIGIASVVATVAIVGLGASWLLGRLERRAARPHRTWTIVACAVFVVSLLGPAGGVTAGAKLGLAALHVIVAAVLVLGLPAVRGRASS